MDAAPVRALGLMLGTDTVRGTGTGLGAWPQLFYRRISMSGKRRRTENGTENAEEASQGWKCPVCESYFNSEASVLQHLRNKKDYEHEQHRLASSASEPSTVKKRGAGSDSDAPFKHTTTSGRRAEPDETGSGSWYYTGKKNHPSITSDFWSHCAEHARRQVYSTVS
ncbi:MAG: C2H2-type zinc finger protein [Promethearchaeia archaeon]